MASAIAFSGNRYQWSDTLESLGYASEGTHDIPEYHAWELKEAFETDMEGGHTMFPLLCHYSQGFEALARFWQSIV